uniref:Uncharacterized protein n=1 Tax=Phenylobacterium glaciei TaxID=2803784 RepID=A0A974P5D4_9CAUL|nr:hypothetical protein JKL49_09595 [Phenylobacterium glaciei]
MTLPRALIAALALALAATAPALAKPAEERLVLVTVDGLSWQELFHGADPARAADKTFVEDPAALKPQFIDVPDRARALTPFLHDVVAKQGVLLGIATTGAASGSPTTCGSPIPGTTRS